MLNDGDKNPMSMVGNTYFKYNMTSCHVNLSHNYLDQNYNDNLYVLMYFAQSLDLTLAENKENVCIIVDSRNWDRSPGVS